MEYSESRSAWWHPRVSAVPSSRKNHHSADPLPLPPSRSHPPLRTDRRLPSCKRTRTTVTVSCRVRQWPLWHTRAAQAAPLLEACRCSSIRSGSAHGSRLGSAREREPLYFPLRVTNRHPPPLARRWLLGTGSAVDYPPKVTDRIRRSRSNMRAKNLMYKFRI